MSCSVHAASERTASHRLMWKGRRTGTLLIGQYLVLPRGPHNPPNDRGHLEWTPPLSARLPASVDIRCYLAAAADTV